MARTWWLLILLVLALPVRVTAAEDVKQSDPVVVTATKVETRRSELGAAVDVLTEQDLEAFNYDRIEEALRQVPGVEIRRSGTLGKTTNIQIRGFNSNRVQVLVDGMRVKSPTLGAADLSELSLDAIEKIEIVRGPQTTRHGSVAMGGVVYNLT
jgi:vitamin B12 transporter